MKNLNVRKIQNDFFYLSFCENHPATRHIKYKVISFASSNKSITAKKVPSTNLERFL